jgi:AcrR family transcriptional regulator
MNPNQTHDLIIDTASDLFYRKGYNLTGINEIIATAGIAKATLYSHFKSKEDLCIAYLKARDGELLQHISTFCNAQPGGDQRLMAVLEFLLAFFQTENFNGCWCIRTVAEIPADNLNIRRTIQANKAAFLVFIQKLVQENKPGMNPEAQLKLARQIYLLYEGAVAESHLQGDAWPIAESIDILKTML